MIFKVGDKVVLDPVNRKYWSEALDNWHNTRQILKVIEVRGQGNLEVKGKYNGTEICQTVHFSDIRYPEYADRVEPTNTLNPSYYKSKNIEVIDFISEYNLNFSLGNVVKYVARAGKKDESKYLEDLLKAKTYIEHEIKKAQNGPNNVLSSDELDR